MRRRRLRVLLAVLALGSSALGCGAILGIEEEPAPTPLREAGSRESAAADAPVDATDAGDAADAAADVTDASDAADAPAE